MSVPRRSAPARILVVDDHAANRSLMRDLLTRHGYEVSVAGDAATAEQIMRQSPPDLVLLDVVMPGKSGYELCREWKNSPETRLVPVVMITGLSALEDKIRGIEAGADDFLNKPIFPVELFARVASLLRVKEYTDELETADDVLCTLGRSVESRDPYTEGHCERLGNYAAALGQFLGLSQEEQVALRRGGYLHDLGKIAIPDAVLKKQGGLTAEEWSIMRLHPTIGEEICKPLRSLRLVLPIIRHHHEHWNGTGYPDHLQGEEIPMLARILQVVDVYDALRTERPYKPAHSFESARETMLAEARCGLWDPTVVAEFLSMMELRENTAGKQDVA
jgi:putative two-component system response regulator